MGYDLYDEGLTRFGRGRRDKPFFAAGMRDERNLKAGCEMIKSGREAESSSFSWRDVGILFFCDQETTIDNDNTLGYYTIP